MRRCWLEAFENHRLVHEDRSGDEVGIGGSSSAGLGETWARRRPQLEGHRATGRDVGH